MVLGLLQVSLKYADIFVNVLQDWLRFVSVGWAVCDGRARIRVACESRAKITELLSS